MQYKFYDPPLDLFPGQDKAHPEAVKLRNELIALENNSFKNLDAAIARYDYELHFNHHVYIHYSENVHTVEGLYLGELALCHGGSVAVYRECIKRNMNVDQLLGLVGYRYPNLPPFLECNYTSAISLEEAYLGEVPGDYPEDYTADAIAHEDVIAYIKKRREEALEWQRQRQC